MSTITAALQIPATAAADTPLVAPAASAAESAASDDFILALTQALSSAAPPMAAVMTQAIQIAVAADQEPLSAETLAADEAAAAQFASMLVLPWTPQVVVLPAGNGADPLGLLGGTSSSLVMSAKLQAIDADAQAAPGAALLELPSGMERTSNLDAGAMFGLVERQSGPPTAATDAAAARPMQSPVGSPAWSEEFGTRLTLMAERGQHSASLRLSPEHLGPLEIRIAIRDDQASVWFGAAHADTRAAIEHALPRLREMFAAQGMTLTDAGVSHEPPRERLPTSRHSGTSGEAATEMPITISTHTLQRIGLIDAYA